MSCHGTQDHVEPCAETAEQLKTSQSEASAQAFSLILCCPDLGRTTQHESLPNRTNRTRSLLCESLSRGGAKRHEMIHMLNVS